jgi:hypothetical protein
MKIVSLFVTEAIVMADVVPLAPLWNELRLLKTRMLRLERRRKKKQKPGTAAKR